MPKDDPHVFLMSVLGSYIIETNCLAWILTVLKENLEVERKKPCAILMSLGHIIMR